MRNDVDVFHIVKTHRLPYFPKLLRGQLCLSAGPCLSRDCPRPGARQACPGRSHVGKALAVAGHSSVSRLAPRGSAWNVRMRVGVHGSPLTLVKRLLGRCSTFDGASVPLPEGDEEENFTTGVCCGRMHLSGDVLESPGGG